MASSHLFSDDGGGGSGIDDDDMDSLFGDLPSTACAEDAAAFDLQDLFGEQPQVDNPDGNLDGSEAEAMRSCQKLGSCEDDAAAATAASADTSLPTPLPPLPLPSSALLPWPFLQPSAPPEPAQAALLPLLPFLPLPVLAQASAPDTGGPLQPLPAPSFSHPLPLPSVDASLTPQQTQPQQEQQQQQQQHQNQHQQSQQHQVLHLGVGSQQNPYNIDNVQLIAEAGTLNETRAGHSGQQSQADGENAGIGTPVLEVRPQEPQTQTQTQTQMQLAQQGQAPVRSGHHLELRPRCPSYPPPARIDLEENRFEELLPHIQLRSLSFKVIFGMMGVDSTTGKSILDECRAHLANPAYAVERTGTVDPGAVRVFKITLILSAIGYLCRGGTDDSSFGAGERWFGRSRLRAGATASGAAEEAAEVDRGGLIWPEGSTNLVLLFVQLFYRISRTEDKRRKQRRQKRAFDEAAGTAPPKPMSIPMPQFPLPARALNGPAFSGMAYNSPVFLREHLSRASPFDCVSGGSSEEPPASAAASTRSSSSVSSVSSASTSTTARSQSVTSEDSALLSLLSESPPALFSAPSFVPGDGDGQEERPAKRRKASEAGTSYENPLVL